MSDPMVFSQAAARSQFYAFLAWAFADPDTTTQELLVQALPAAESAAAVLNRTETHMALGPVRRELDALSADGLAREHLRVFGHTASGDCPPYEGEYGHPHIFQKTHCLADNNGFYRAFGLALSPDLADRPDHVSVELEFLHVLARKEAYAIANGHDEEKLAIVRDATRNYLRDHLGRWAPVFAARLQAKAGEGVYAALGALLAAFIADEAFTFGVTVSPSAALADKPNPDDGAAGCAGCLANEGLAPGTGGEP